MVRGIGATLLLCWICVVTEVQSSARLPAAQVNALLSLYNSTQGPHWYIKWPVNNAFNPCEWHGVTCSSRNDNVVRLELLHNGLEGKLVGSIENLPQLNLLDLSGNNLLGSIPSSLGRLTNLHILYLDSNQLSGSIPLSLGNLTNLLSLSLYSNQLSGSIPSSLGSLAQLKYLYLYSNQLSGSFPLSIGRLIHLQNLFLDSNQLSGTIPDLSAIANLLFLSVYDNRLSGTIPVSTLRSGHLQELFLSANCFSGTIPPEICTNINMTELVMGGLHAAQSCTQRAIRVPTSFGLRSSYTQSTAIHGFIPSCIFNMPSLVYCLFLEII